VKEKFGKGEKFFEEERQKKQIPYPRRKKNLKVRNLQEKPVET